MGLFGGAKRPPGGEGVRPELVESTDAPSSLPAGAKASRKASLDAARKEKREKNVDTNEVAAINAKIKAAAAAPKPEKKETRLPTSPDQRAMSEEINKKIAAQQQMKSEKKKAVVKGGTVVRTAGDIRAGPGQFQGMGSGWEPSADYDDHGAGVRKSKWGLGRSGNLGGSSKSLKRQGTGARRLD